LKTIKNQTDLSTLQHIFRSINTIFVRAEVVLIRIYQVLFSFDHGIPHKLFPQIKICLFEPSCSEYSRQAVIKYGMAKGNWLAVKRIVRCGPWSLGKDSFDPVP
jgi:uncharacterized protein